MKEKIWLVSSVNAAELTRSLAGFGKRQIGVRIMSAVELASYAIQLSGKSVKYHFIPKNEEAVVIYSFLNDVPYFMSASYSDASNLAATLDTVRSLICDDENNTMKTVLSGGEFPEKNRAIYEIYKKYNQVLTERKCIDSIGLIRMAMAEAMPFCADFCFVSEFELSPLEKAMLGKLSDGEVKECSIYDLYSTKKEAIHIESYTDSYGASNEVQHIVGEICRNNIHLDNCTVAISNTNEYAQLFYEASVRYNIPMTFGCGVPIMNGIYRNVTHNYGKSK